MTIIKEKKKKITFYNNKIASAWNGIRALDNDKYAIVGTSLESPTHGLIYIGDLDGQSPSYHKIRYPGAIKTNAWGIDYLGNDHYRITGTYEKGSDKIVSGFIFEGKLIDLNRSSRYIPYFTSSRLTYLQSTMGDLVVGNADSPEYYGQSNLKLGPSQAFVYNLKTGDNVPIVYPGSKTTVVYGIWHNKKNSYTICGGYSHSSVEINKIYETTDGITQTMPIGHGFIVNYNAKEKHFSKWTRTVDKPAMNFTHFQGISSRRSHHYELAADSIKPKPHASWVKVIYKDHKFKTKKWIELEYPSGYSGGVTTSVAGKSVVGQVIQNNNKLVSYQGRIK